MGYYSYINTRPNVHTISLRLRTHIQAGLVHNGNLCDNKCPDVPIHPPPSIEKSHSSTVWSIINQKRPQFCQKAVWTLCVVLDDKHCCGGVLGWMFPNWIVRRWRRGVWDRWYSCYSVFIGLSLNAKYKHFPVFIPCNGHIFEYVGLVPTHPIIGKGYTVAIQSGRMDSSYLCCLLMIQTGGLVLSMLSLYDLDGQTCPFWGSLH